MACTGTCPPVWQAGMCIEFPRMLGVPCPDPGPCPSLYRGLVVTSAEPLTVRYITADAWAACGYAANVAYPACSCDGTQRGPDVTGAPDCPFAGAVVTPGGSSGLSFDPAWLVLSAGATLFLLALLHNRREQEDAAARR